MPNLSSRELAFRLTSIGASVGFTVAAVSDFGRPSVAEAAGKQCDNTKALVVGVGYANNPLIPNRPNQADPVDFIVGSPDFGISVIERSGAEIARANLINRGDYSSELFTLRGQSNTSGKDGSEAMQVAVYSDNDQPQKNPQTGVMEKPRINVVVPCGYTTPVYFGRVAPLSEIERALNNANYPFRTVADAVNEAMTKATGKSAGLNLEKAMQEEIRKAFRDYVDKQKAAQAPKAPEPAAKTSEPAVKAPEPAAKAPEPAAKEQPQDKDSGAGEENAILRAIATVTDLPARVFAPGTQPPIRWLLDAGVDLATLLLAFGVLFDRPKTRLQTVRVNRIRTRGWNTLAWPVREVRYRLTLRTHNRGVASGAIDPAVTPAPVRTYPKPWRVV